jgi:hypothetical protein
MRIHIRLQRHIPLESLFIMAVFRLSNTDTAEKNFYGGRHNIKIGLKN